MPGRLTSNPENITDRSMRSRIIPFVLVILLAACESYDTNTNIESMFSPEGVVGEDQLNGYVNDMLHKMYPKIGKYTMRIKGKTCHADFVMGGNIYHVKFDVEGRWLESEVGVAYEFSLPERIQEILKSDEYKGWMVIEKSLTETPSEKLYKVVFKKGQDVKSLWLDRNGEIQKEKTDTHIIVN